MNFKERRQERREKQALLHTQKTAESIVDHISAQVTVGNDGPFQVNIGEAPKACRNKPEKFFENVGRLAARYAEIGSDTSVIIFEHYETLLHNMTLGPKNKLKHPEMTVIFRTTEV
jgi:hypothetical protein